MIKLEMKDRGGRISILQFSPPFCNLSHFRAGISKNCSASAHPLIPYVYTTCLALQRFIAACTCSAGVSHFSTRRAPRKSNTLVDILLLAVERDSKGTTPGESTRKICFVMVTYCHIFVSPAMGATQHVFLPHKVLTSDDLPMLE